MPCIEREMEGGVPCIEREMEGGMPCIVAGDMVRGRRCQWPHSRSGGRTLNIGRVCSLCDEGVTIACVRAVFLPLSSTSRIQL